MKLQEQELTQEENGSLRQGVGQDAGGLLGVLNSRRESRCQSTRNGNNEETVDAQEEPIFACNRQVNLQRVRLVNQIAD